MRAATPELEELSEQLIEAHQRAAAIEAQVMRDRFRPPSRLTGTQWSDEFRWLSPEASSSRAVTKFHSSDAPYQREFMDACTDPKYTRVVGMWASQTGKTECVNNVVGFHMHQSPVPMLVMQPTLEMAETWSKDRLAPMIRDTPVLTPLVAASRSRDSGNTLLHKSFAGGHITIAGANSPASLASRPIGLLICDEIDRYSRMAGAEGDPILIGWRRTATFPDRKRIEISSPTIRRQSKIEKAFEASDQRYYWIPCPHCKEPQLLKWGSPDSKFGIKWDAGKPETAYYLCEHCAGVIEEADKAWMLAKGKWVAKNPESDIAGFWLNALYSPWFTWEHAVRDWIESQGTNAKLRVFVNTVLCELWDEFTDQLDAGALRAHVRVYPGWDENDPTSRDRELAPEGVAVLTRSVDVQGDRLETSVYGWGDREAGWLLDHRILPGNPSIPFGADKSPWNELDELLKRYYRLEVGVSLVPAVTFVDSGGHHSGQVYSFTRARINFRCFAIKGASNEHAPLLGRPTRNNREKAILYPVGSFTLKEIMLARLAKILTPGPGFISFPAWITADLLQQFNNETLVPRVVAGVERGVWKQDGPTEQLHLLIYAYAALHQLGLNVVQNLGNIAAKLKAEGEAHRKKQPKEKKSGPAGNGNPRTGGYVQRWRSY